jgi:predicted N-acetyltransferase YhbS
MSPQLTTRPAAPGDAAAITALHARVFGPGRFARSAYRVREGTADVSPFCRLAFMGARLIAALRLTEVSIGGTPGALLLGPLAVSPELSGQGFGKRLVSEAMAEARAAGKQLVVLVGDEPYYGRFGFKRVTPGQISFPGPVDPARILAAELAEGALASYRGLVRGEHPPRA